MKPSLPIDVYRVQDSEGRGPWRPGFSLKWMDADIGNRHKLPSVFVEFGFNVLSKRRVDEHIGCACRSLEQLSRWFTRSELDRLHIFGYHIVRLGASRILAESENQLVFVRNRPLWDGADIIE